MLEIENIPRGYLIILGILLLVFDLEEYKYMFHFNYMYVLHLVILDFLKENASNTVNYWAIICFL